MKKFILVLLLFASCFFLFDKLFIFVMSYNPTIQKDKRLELLLSGQFKKDLVILGSSRGARNIIASQLERETGIPSYNLSYPGSDVEFHEFILRTLLKFNKPPSTILLAIDDPLELITTDLISFRLESLYPFVKYDHVVNELVNRGEENRWLTRFLVLTRLNKSNFKFTRQHFTEFDSMMTCGSMPVSFRGSRDFEFNPDSTHYSKETEVPAKINAYRKLVELCDRHKIKLVIVFSPNYKNHNIAFEHRIRSLTGGKAIYYIYDRSNPVYKDKKFFYDRFHLMSDGSSIFTSEVSNFINTIHIQKVPGHYTYKK